MKKFDENYFDEDFYKSGDKGAIRNLDSPHYRMFASKVDTCIQKMTSHKKIRKVDFTILDVGCGVGWEAKHYIEYGYDAYGCDVSAWAFNNSVLPDGHRFCGDIRRLVDVIPPAKFDLVIANRILAYLPSEEDIINALKQLIMFAKRNILLAIICSDHKGKMVQEWAKGSGRITFLPKAWYEKQFKSLGLMLRKDLTEIMLAGDWDCVWWLRKK